MRQAILAATVTVALSSGAAAFEVRDYRDWTPPSRPVFGPAVRGITGFATLPEWQGLSGPALGEVAEAHAAGDRARATALSDALVARVPGADVALHLRARLRREAGDLAGALADLEAVTLWSSAGPMVLAERCAVRARSGDVAGAASDCDAAVAWMERGGLGYTASGPPFVYAVRAGFRLLRDDRAGADRDLAKVLRMYPRHALSLRLRGWLRALRGDAAGAARDVAAARERQRDVDTRLTELLGVTPPTVPGRRSPS